MYVTVNDQQIYYQKLGKGKDLVMLHGWANDVSSFWNVAQELKGDFTVWLIDLPGFGRSETPKKAFTVADYSETVYQFLKELKIEKPVILGHSHGGRTTIKLLVQHPEVTDKIILEDAAGIRPKKDLGAYFAYIGAKVFHFLVPNVFHIKDRVRQNYYKRLQSDYLDAGELKKTLINILKEDLTDDIRKIKADTLMLWGEKDTNAESSFAVGKRMYRMIEKARFESFENAGHHPHLDNPKMFVYFVRDFAS